MPRGGGGAWRLLTGAAPKSRDWWISICFCPWTLVEVLLGYGVGHYAEEAPIATSQQSPTYGLESPGKRLLSANHAAVQILQEGFIRKHIHDFLADIVSRESHKIGEGTKVLKAAAVNMLADDEVRGTGQGASGGSS